MDLIEQPYLLGGGSFQTSRRLGRRAVPSSRGQTVQIIPLVSQDRAKYRQLDQLLVLRDLARNGMLVDLLQSKALLVLPLPFLPVLDRFW